MTKHQEMGSESEVTDMSLAREIKNLEREMVPERDLWLGIERQIQDYPQKGKLTLPDNWMPYGVAASLLIAVSALLLNLVELNRSATGLVSLDQSIDRMQVEYVQIRNPLVQKFQEVNRNLDEQTLNDLYLNLDILAQARRDIEAQVREDPQNRRLVEMLMRIHEQELELLQQDYNSGGRSM